MPPLRFGYTRFASCSGCQLAFLNCEEVLPQLSRRLDVAFFGMASSTVDAGEPLDLILIEGSVSRPEDLTELLALRRRARVLVAVGACALTGGINALGEPTASPSAEGFTGRGQRTGRPFLHSRWSASCRSI